MALAFAVRSYLLRSFLLASARFDSNEQVNAVDECGREVAERDAEEYRYDHIGWVVHIQVQSREGNEHCDHRCGNTELFIIEHKRGARFKARNGMP